MSYKPEEEEKAKHNKRLLKAWGALVLAVSVAGGTGYSLGIAEVPKETTQIEGDRLVKLDGCEQVRFGDVSTYHCGDKFVIIGPR